MVGSLDIRTSASLTSEFEDLLSSYESPLPTGQKHYMGMIHRPFNHPVVVHLHHDLTLSSKLQFLDMPKRTLMECVGITESLFIGNALELPVVRLHLGCDITGVHASWFRESMRVLYKQNSEEYGRVNSESLNRKVQTLYFGGKHNGFVVYDKRAERLNEYKKEKARAKRSGKENSVPVFEELYGFPEDTVITRIERKYGNRLVPQALSTIGGLLTNALSFDPFNNVVLCPPLTKEPDLEKLGLRRYRKAITWQFEVSKYGFNTAHKRLSKCGNVIRELSEIKAAFESLGEVPAVTKETLLELYQTSTKNQL